MSKLYEVRNHFDDFGGALRKARAREENLNKIENCVRVLRALAPVKENAPYRDNALEQLQQAVTALILEDERG